MAHPPNHRCYSLALLVIWLLHAVSSMAKDFWAIDCGGSEGFTSTTNTTWEADGDYVHGGVSRGASNVSSGIYSTLRAFESDRPAKGCYTVPVGNGAKVLARARFYYGNYDGLGQPPTFRLQFDANAWGVVETTMDGVKVSEAIYVARRSSTSVCLARGSTGQTPFISALTVAVLEDYMYNSVNSSVALFWVSRVAFGASDDIRDRYGRLWSHSTLSLNISDYTILNNTATDFNATHIADNPPAEVFQTAIAAASSSSNISISTPYLRTTPQPIYFNMYFTDPDVPGGNGNRSFHVSLNGGVIFNDFDPIVPPYGKAVQYTSAVRMGSESTVFDLVPTADATKPPVISAWELFVISDILSDGTDGRDVRGLQSLQDKFKTLRDWAGDPCLPGNYNWEWVTCTSDDSPRVIQLDLKGYGLSGELPDFSSLDALQSIDLSNNSLSGDIPAFLAEMPDLQKLNLAENDFASIPSSLVQKSSLQLNVSGNPKLPCTGQVCSPADSPQSQPPANSISSATGNSNEFVLAALSVCIMYFAAAVAQYEGLAL